MAWVEVEEDETSFVLIAGTVGLATGAAVGLYSDFCTGFLAYLGVAIALMLLREIWSQAWLPWEARRAAKLVLAWFRAQFPKERVEGVAVRAIEPERYVIAVRHGFGFPTPRSYYAIARPELIEIAELPADNWWPRGLK